MHINLNLLPVNIDEDVMIPEEFYKNTDIDSLEDIHVTGRVFYNLSDEVEIDFHVTGKMILTDSITLDKITKDLDLEINESLEEIGDESTFFYEKSKNILDIIEFLWENIVLEVPISLTNASGTNLSGEGWGLNEEREKEINPEFLKLNEIYKGGE